MKFKYNICRNNVNKFQHILAFCIQMKEILNSTESKEFLCDSVPIFSL